MQGHDSSTVLPGTRFIRFPKATAGFLEGAYQSYAANGGTRICGLPAHNSQWLPKETADRGTYFYNKTTNETTWTPPADYHVDFLAMNQTKISTRFERAVKRVEKEKAIYAEAPNAKKKKEEERGGISSFFAGRKKVANTSSLPDEVIEQDGLLVKPGQMISVKAERDDGWTYGTVISSADDDNQPDKGGSLSSKTSRANSGASGTSTVHRAKSQVANTDDTGVSFETGWFPTSCIRKPTNEEFKSIKHLLGDASSDDLAAPPDWEDVPKDQRFTASRYTLQPGAEYNRVVSHFQKSLKKAKIPITVVGVERIQNYAMWQSYAVKKIAVVNREKGYDANMIEDNFVRSEGQWLFHGTNAEVLPKIVQQGFNRSFCGKNATFYGKGVYFARDSAYSVKPHYAIPDRDGVQYMFLTRVVVGAFHEGRKDLLTPDLRFPDLDVLYDSTVKAFKKGFSDTPWITRDDPPDDPQIYVTYHDAQAYPEYLVKFKQGGGTNWNSAV
jgi:poly [ADP-ribose] polymerase 10/14/15